MSLRYRLAIAFALMAALATAVAGVVNYRQSRSELYSQVDSSLYSAAQQAAARVAVGQRPSAGPLTPPTGDDAPKTQLYLTQRISPEGIVTTRSNPALPVTERDLSLATSNDPGIIELRTVKLPDGESLRMASVSLSGGGILQLATSTDNIYQALGAIGRSSLIIGIAIVALAALLGLALARTITRPLERLTRSAEAVAASGVPSPMPESGRKDEIGRLSAVLSRMLASLSRSRDQQERLIQDAGHELRTPLTSITTNLSLLERLDELDPSTQRQIISDLKSESAEMSDIISQLVALTSVEGEREEQVDMDALAREMAEKVSRRHGRQVLIEGHTGLIQGQPRALRHAILNLLENAAKFDPQGQIKIRLSPRSIMVIDQGPGIPIGQEEAIFGRFHRAVDARSYPGSGLGLSIVAEVARSHGGKPLVGKPSQGGAAVGFTFKP